MPRTANDLPTYPIAPDVTMGFREKLHVLRVFHTGPGLVRDRSGPLAIIRFRPRRLLPPLVVVTSPQGIRDVLGGSDGSIDKQDTVHSQTRAWGDNLFNLPQAKWANRRRVIQPLFTKKHVASFSDHISDAADALADSWLKQGSIDLDREIRKLTLRVLGRSIFGIDLGNRADDLALPLESAQRWVYGRVSRPVRAPRWLPIPARHRLRAALGAVRAIIDEAIASAREDPESGGELIQLLLNATDPETGRPLTDQAISDELFIFVLAGHDTTSTTLTYALWALGRDQQIQDRLAAEVSSLGDRPLTVDDVRDLPYTVRVIHESLRMCPPGAALTRSATRDVIVDGFRVPAGANFVIGIYAIHHDPAWWDDPETFDPDRFTPERSAGRERWQFIPFGGGPRACVGQHFAMLEATVALASIVRKLKLNSTDPGFPLDLAFTVTAGAPIPAEVSARVPSNA